MSVKIYHNPQCSKSRRTLALLRERKLEIEVIDYLASPPRRDELLDIVRMLRIAPRELLREGQSEFRQLGVDAGSMNDKQVIDIMLRYPAVIQRPIVVSGGRARIGRPPESVLEIL